MKLTFEQIRQYTLKEYIRGMRKSDERDNYKQAFNECDDVKQLLSLLDELGFDAHHSEGYEYIFDAIIKNNNKGYGKFKRTIRSL